MAKRYKGRNANLFYALERETRNEAPTELKYEFHRRGCDRALESLMNCRENIKTHGEHGKINRPVKAKIVRDISVPKAILLCRSGAVIEHDTINQVRHLVFNGDIVGKLRHGDVLAIRKSVPMNESRKPGTNIVEYKAV